ncbi:MAG: VTT domain-containing protein [Pseudomonadota bacterium]
MDAWFQPDATLAGLFAASFLAATLLPGGSEAVLFAVLQLQPQQTLAALLLATLGNTLGGMSTYVLGRLIPEKVSAGGTAKFSVRHTAVLDRWGPAALLLAWLPLVGDALCAAAGWLRLPWLPCALWMLAGKAARYGAVVWLAGRFSGA